MAIGLPDATGREAPEELPPAGRAIAMGADGLAAVAADMGFARAIGLLRPVVVAPPKGTAIGLLAAMLLGTGWKGLVVAEEAALGSSCERHGLAKPS